MKKVILVLAMLLIATPAWAGLTIEASQRQKSGPDCNVVTITYDMDDTDSNIPRAFALEISLTQENDANIGEVIYVNPDFHVYPGSIQISGGVVTDQGTPVAVSDVCSMIVEMGSLWAPTDPCDAHKEQPDPCGILLRFRVADNEACHVDLALNAIRGGMVLEDTNIVMSEEQLETYVNLEGCDVDECSAPVPCFPSGYTTYPDWQAYVANGWDADCWCAPPEGVGYQCDGDADNLTQGFLNYRVYTDDFDILVANWGKKMGPPGTGANPCADFDHKEEGFLHYRVYMDDFNILVGNWGKKDTELPGDCPRVE